MSTSKQDILSNELPDATNILIARLDNWTHAISMLQDFVESQMSIQKSTTSGLEKSKKAVSDAPKFDYANAANSTASPTAAAAAAATVTNTIGSESGGRSDPGESTVDTTSASQTEEGSPVSGDSNTGIAEAFQDLRAKVEAMLNKSIETENQLKEAVLPHLNTLRGDIDKHIKGLKSTGLKGQKEVEKARQITQKNVENLGTHTSSAASGQKVEPKNDPYVIHRLVKSSVNDQLLKENVHADSLLSMQKNFLTLERHIVQVMQEAMHVLEGAIHNYSSTVQESMISVSGTFAAILPDHEWNGFAESHSNVLVKEDQQRSMSDVTFVNDTHPSTEPIMEGILQRKGKIMKSYTSGYFVLTPFRFLHQYKSQDYVQEPTPEFSLYLPECTVGPASTQESGKFKFHISGKEAGKTITTKHTFAFKTSTYAEMTAWHDAIVKAAGVSAPSTKISPVTSPTSPPVEAEVAETPIASEVPDHSDTVDSTTSQQSPVDPAMAAATAATSSYATGPLSEGGDTVVSQPRSTSEQTAAEELTESVVSDNNSAVPPNEVSHTLV